MAHTRRTFGRGTAAAVVAGAGLALLAACGSTAASTNAGDIGQSNAGVTTAKQAIASVRNAISTWPAAAPVSHPADLHGKTIMLLPLSDNIPVIHGDTAAAEQALAHMGATVSVCDGKFDPTAVTSCLQQAQSQHVTAVMSLFVDYQMAPNAFQAAAKSGVKVLVGAEPPDGGQTSGPDLAFFDNSGTVSKLDQLLSEAALTDKGTGANALWLKLTDSPTTANSTQAGIDEFQKLCPTCGLATSPFTSANLDKLPSAVSAALVAHPTTNVVIVPVDTYVPQAVQGIQSAGFTGKVEVISASSDLAGLQRVAGGQQAHDLGTSVVFEGYKMANALIQLLSGDSVTPDSAIATRDFTKANVAQLSLTTAAYNSTDWFGSDSFEQTFYQAWAAK